MKINVSVNGQQKIYSGIAQPYQMASNLSLMPSELRSNQMRANVRLIPSDLQSNVRPINAYDPLRPLPTNVSNQLQYPLDRSVLGPYLMSYVKPGSYMY